MDFFVRRVFFFSAPRRRRGGLTRASFAVLALGISAFSLGNTNVLRAQTATDIPAPDLTAVQPTVTAEMGDLGGKFFGQPPDPAKTKQYYIAAEPELWNFAPEGQDPVCGLAFPTQLLLNRASWKIRYVQYADPNFTARVLPTERLGILGQVLRGVTGQYLRVTFLNRAWRAMSMHPHGVKYDKDSEGSYYKPVEGRGAAVAPGGKFTYVWQLDEAAAPRPDEPSSKAWLYHSHVVGDEETNLGAVGFIIVTDPARARPDGTPRDVDREMGALFTIYNETLGGAVEDVDDRPANAPPGQGPNAPQPTWAEAQQAAEEGQRHTINGRAFGNLGGLDMNEGERVRWYLFGLGSESDFHSAHWHGLRALEEGKRRTDVVELLPASMKVADTTADSPGAWLLHCHVAEHMSKGMFARFNVLPRDGAKSVVSTEPEAAFFGMPQSLATLRIGSAEVSLGTHAATPGGEVNLVGQVTVPDPFPAALNTFSVQVGNKTIELHPDASGLAISPDAILLLKNTSLAGNGIVRGGTLRFELTLRGEAWLAELQRLRALKENRTPAVGANFPLTIQVGEARHQATVTLQATPKAASVTIPES